MAKDSVVIIDYGSGNLRSAGKAFERVVQDQELDIDVKISSDPQDVLAARHIVLPGQGAFGDCINGLNAVTGMREALEQAVIKNATPFLGICVGMQLMATRGLEYGLHAGLNWIPGEVVKIEPADKTLKIPHMGWNELTPQNPHEQNDRHFVLRSETKTGQTTPHYYFVHSFMFKCKEDRHSIASTEYGGPVTAIVGRDNMIGVQFHPEKSQHDGLTLIGRFLNWKP